MAIAIDSYQVQDIATRLGKDSRLKGNLRFSKSLKICGSFEGNIDSTGFLYIEEGAVVKADVIAQDVVVAGEVHGNIEAKALVEMLPTGKIYGNVRAAKLRIAEGVVFEGKCEMIRNVEGIDVFSTVLKDLRRAIQMADEES
jgi:cytoskeletal protein CcmA (bactofilin family)